MNTIFARLTFFQKMVVTLTQLAIFVISHLLRAERHAHAGRLVAFNAYAAMILGPFVILGQNWQTIQNGTVALVRAEKMLSYPDRSVFAEGRYLAREAPRRRRV